MGKVICLVVPVVQSNIDAFIVNARGDANAGTGKLCADLIEATCRDGLLWAVDVVGRDGGMMRGLFGEVRNLDLVASRFGLDLVALEYGHIVFGLPLTSEELSERRVVWLAGLALDILQVLCEPEAQAGKQTAKLIVRVADACKDVGSVEVMPVLEVGDGLEQLGRQGEADSGNVRDSDELLQDADKGFEFTAVVGRLLAHGSGGAGSRGSG